MYQDDHDWAQYQDLPEEEGMGAGDSGHENPDNSMARRRRRGTAAAKRMPIEREEVVRLILQGLRDIGYE